MMKKMFKFFILVGCILLLCFSILQKTSIGYLTLHSTNRIPHFMKKDIVLESGDTYKIRIFVLNKRITYKTRDFKVAYVNLNGKVYAKKPGVTYIQVNVGKEQLKCRVRVLKISRKKLLLSVGDQYQLRIYGDGVFSFNNWKSSNPSIATVDRFGRITTKQKGRVNISCRVKGKTLTCFVKVEQ